MWTSPDYDNVKSILTWNVCEGRGDPREWKSMTQDEHRGYLFLPFEKKNHPPMIITERENASTFISSQISPPSPSISPISPPLSSCDSNSLSKQENQRLRKDYHKDCKIANSPPRVRSASVRRVGGGYNFDGDSKIIPKVFKKEPEQHWKLGYRPGSAIEKRKKNAELRSAALEAERKEVSMTNIGRAQQNAREKELRSTSVFIKNRREEEEKREQRGEERRDGTRSETRDEKRNERGERRREGRKGDEVLSVSSQLSKLRTVFEKNTQQSSLPSKYMHHYFSTSPERQRNLFAESADALKDKPDKKTGQNNNHSSPRTLSPRLYPFFQTPQEIPHQFIMKQSVMEREQGEIKQDKETGQNYSHSYYRNKNAIPLYSSLYNPRCYKFLPPTLLNHIPPAGVRTESAKSTTAHSIRPLKDPNYATYSSPRSQKPFHKSIDELYYASCN